MHLVRCIAVFSTLALISLFGPVLSASAGSADREVTVGSTDAPFSGNKQNEPAVAIDADHINVVAAGANDNIDMEDCNAGPDNDCPFTPGVGGSGISFSFNGGLTWHQPTYQGLSARDCNGVPGDDDPLCVPEVGDIGTLPWYFENGLVSDGDPALAFGPVPDEDGNFSWDNGSRLYYANLTSALDPANSPFKGFEAIYVSRIDGPASTGLTEAIVDDQDNWHDPVLVSKQNAALFSDKEQVWADNAESSLFFGNAYVCYAAFRSPTFRSQPLIVATSSDGGETWSNHQISAATNNTNSSQGFGRSGCTIRTTSDGTAYVFALQFGFGTPGDGWQVMAKSTDGGAHWTQAKRVLPVTDTCVAFEPAIGRCVQDGVGGARNDLGAAPSVDIANGAPTGSDATDLIAMTWVDGRDGLNNEHVMFSTSTDGTNWSEVVEIEQAGDRGYYSAPALSPDGTDVYIVYNAFLEPFKESAVGPANDRPLVGVILHADVAGGVVGSFTELHRGEPGDGRASSQNNMAGEFLGDYVYAAATRVYATAVWNDVRDGENCDDIDQYRQDLHDAVVDGTELPTAPAVQANCPGTFGNSDIWGWSGLDPS
jgi:hypothetical protein